MDNGSLFWGAFIGPWLLLVIAALGGVALAFVAILAWGLNQAVSWALDRLVARVRSRGKTS